MTMDELRDHLLGLRDSSEEMPFGPDALVYKVRGKVFALLAFKATPLRLSLKCDPIHALVLRSQYSAVQPGYHLNKRHWNTLTLDGSIPENEVLALVIESYRLAARGLPKADRVALGLV